MSHDRLASLTCPWQLWLDLSVHLMQQHSVFLLCQLAQPAGQRQALLGFASHASPSCLLCAMSQLPELDLPGLLDVPLLAGTSAAQKAKTVM